MINKTLQEIITDYKADTTEPLTHAEIRGIMADIGIEMMYNEGLINKTEYDVWKSGVTKGYSRIRKNLSEEIKNILGKKYSEEETNAIIERIYHYACLDV